MRKTDVFFVCFRSERIEPYRMGTCGFYGKSNSGGHAPRGSGKFFALLISF
jgi:hypothetical protein